ncbi:DUF3088 family protein [Sphingomonas sp. MMS24-J13]|uniref:DUF3088 family protein n=1 Tax=Sphingomonas sp. MMS24-J13 TaxID=3238686 RepID=UPI00384E5BC5
MKPGFTNAGMGPFYCGDSVSVEGFLSFFPELRAKVDVAYVEFPRPRLPIADLLGEENQSIPVLVLAGKPSSDRVSVKQANGVSFITNERDIRRYLSAKFDLPEAG